MALFHPAGACGADLLPSGTTDLGTTDKGVQVVLTPVFAGCGRLMRYNVTAICTLNGNQKCNIVFQLWRPTESGHFSLINSNTNVYNHPNNADDQVSLSFPLDIEFAAGDVIGFFHDSANPLEVYTASAGSHSYLQWNSVATLRSMLATEDAVTKMSRLPILNVEGNYATSCLV